MRFDFAVYKDQIEQIAIFIKYQYEGTNSVKKLMFYLIYCIEIVMIALQVINQLL